jgi:hypothetical protein
LFFVFFALQVIQTSRFSKNENRRPRFSLLAWKQTLPEKSSSTPSILIFRFYDLHLALIPYASSGAREDLTALTLKLEGKAETGPRSMTMIMVGWIYGRGIFRLR